VTGLPPTQLPAALQVSPNVHAMASSHAMPVRGVEVHVDVPLQVRSTHVLLVHVTVVPAPHTPAAVQASLYVHALPSSHDMPVRGVAVQVAVPLHERREHVVLVQVTAVPTQLPAAQTSPNVQALPSSQAVAVRQAHAPPDCVHT
jgi:hypothetical protein